MRVLVADSVRMFQQLISSLFENTGLEPVVAQSGTECLSALERDRFGFICISMHMEDVNDAFLSMTGRQSTDIKGKGIGFFEAEVQRDARSQDIWTTLESQGHWEGEFTLRGAAGQTTTCVLILDRIESGSNVMNQYMGIWREKR